MSPQNHMLLFAFCPSHKEQEQFCQDCLFQIPFHYFEILIMQMDLHTDFLLLFSFADGSTLSSLTCKSGKGFQVKMLEKVLIRQSSVSFSSLSLCHCHCNRDLPVHLSTSDCHGPSPVHSNAMQTDTLEGGILVTRRLHYNVVLSSKAWKNIVHPMVLVTGYLSLKIIPIPQSVAP